MFTEFVRIVPCFDTSRFELRGCDYADEIRTNDTSGGSGRGLPSRAAGLSSVTPTNIWPEKKS